MSTVGETPKKEEAKSSAVTKKTTDFVNNRRIGSNRVSVIPGLHVTELKDKLEKKGITKASQVLGSFLLLDRNEEKFKDWLMSNCGGLNDKHHKPCYDALQQWCKEHID